MDEQPSITIVMVQRERFSPSKRSLDSLLQTNSGGYPIIYVDNASPPVLRDYLCQQANEHDIRLVRYEQYTSPLHARNAIVPLLETEYVVFVDNDVMFGAGWLEALFQCASDHGADVVTPLIQQGELEENVIHTAGGSVEIIEEGGKKVLNEVQRFLGKSIAEVSGELIEEPTQMAEFHCILVRTDFLNRLGLFDENYLATSEHLDFALEVQRANGAMWFTPGSRVTYLRPPPVSKEDRLFFSLRWSNSWVGRSEDHLFKKWNIQPYDRVKKFSVKHRRKAYEAIHQRVSRFAGLRFANLVVKFLDLKDTWLAQRRQSEQVTKLLSNTE